MSVGCADTQYDRLQTICVLPRAALWPIAESGGPRICHMTGTWWAVFQSSSYPHQLCLLYWALSIVKQAGMEGGLCNVDMLCTVVETKGNTATHWAVSLHSPLVNKCAIIVRRLMPVLQAASALRSSLQLIARDVSAAWWVG